MPLGERPAGAGFQILLESRSGPFISKLQRDDDRPRSMLKRVPARTVVVPVQACVDVVGDSNVVMIRLRITSKNVDETLSYILFRQ